VAIKRVVDHMIDVNAHFVVILIAIEFSGDADGLLMSVGDLGDAVSLVDLGTFWYIQSGLLTKLYGVPSTRAYISFDIVAPNHPLTVD
jgi:hypothetical protein